MILDRVTAIIMLSYKFLQVVLAFLTINKMYHCTCFLLFYPRPYCATCLSKTRHTSCRPWRNLPAATRSTQASHTNAHPSCNSLSPHQLARLHISRTGQFRSYSVFGIRNTNTAGVLLWRSVPVCRVQRHMSGVGRALLGLRRFLKVRYLILTGAVSGGVAANQVTYYHLYFTLLLSTAYTTWGIVGRKRCVCCTSECLGRRDVIQR